MIAVSALEVGKNFLRTAFSSDFTSMNYDKYTVATNIHDDNAPDEFVFFPLFIGDSGIKQDRPSKAEFLARQPSCKIEFTTSKLVVEVANSGTLMSNLIILEHEFVFCTLAAHGPADGFTASHAGEVSSNPIDALLTGAAVPPGGAVQFEIKVPQFNYAGLRNIFFRGRLNTLGSKPVPKQYWTFAGDPRVTEIHLSVP